MLLPFGTAVFRANAGEHFGQTPRGRHGGGGWIAASAVMMPDRRHPPIDRRRVEPGGCLIAGEDGDDIGRCRQRGQAVLRAPRREDYPIGVIRAPRRAGAGRFGVCGRPLDLFVEDRGERRLVRNYRNERGWRQREVKIDRRRLEGVWSDHIERVPRSLSARYLFVRELQLSDTGERLWGK